MKVHHFCCTHMQSYSLSLCSTTDQCTLLLKTGAVQFQKAKIVPLFAINASTNITVVQGPNGQKTGLKQKMNVAQVKLMEPCQEV